jgi:predicted transcriptional regulator
MVSLYEEALGGTLFMPCIAPDGKPTSSGLELIRALKNVTLSPEEVSDLIGLPLYRTRSSLRELKDSGYVEEVGGKYKLSKKAEAYLK